MSARLSPQREAEIRERAEAATPGPWSLIEDEGDTFRAPAWEVLHPSDEMVARVREWAPADAKFIAHSPEDVNALLAELAAVRAERDEVAVEVARFGIYGTATSAAKALVARASELVDENASLRAQLAKQRDEIADDIHRAELPVFAETENPVLVVKVVRAIDVRLAECGPEAPYWVAKAGDPR